MEALNPSGELKTYPGSPELARQLLRPQDHLVLMELHPSENETLRNNLGWDPKVSIHHRDGFEGGWSLVPPKLRRGLVLIDPAYELQEDYYRAPQTLAKAYKRWDTGIYILWYPLLGKERDRTAVLFEEIGKTSYKSLLRVEITTSPQPEDWGMYGSGLVIVNPPWNLDKDIQSFLENAKGTLAPEFDFILEPIENYYSK